MKNLFYEVFYYLLIYALRLWLYLKWVLLKWATLIAQSVRMYFHQIIDIKCTLMKYRFIGMYSFCQILSQNYHMALTYPVMQEKISLSILAISIIAMEECVRLPSWVFSHTSGSHHYGTVALVWKEKGG